MQITMLGTGSAFAKNYFNNNALIQVPHFQLMVDCGITAPFALHQLGVEPDQIDGILISHLHADHIGGLEEIAFRMKFRYHRKIKLFISPDLTNTLWEHSLKAGLEDLSENQTCLADYFDVVELAPNRTHTLAEGLTVELIRTEHVPLKTSYSMVFNDYLFYSADLQFDPALLQTLYEQRGTRYFLHDCQLEEPATVHTTLSQLLTLPEHLQSKLYLMHYGDRMEDYVGKTGAMQFIRQQVPYTFQQ